LTAVSAVDRGSRKSVPAADEVKARDDSLSSNAGAWIGISDKLNDATFGSDYGINPPSARERLLAVKYLPIAWRITFGVARDAFKSGDNYPFEFVRQKLGEVEKTDWSDVLLSEMQNCRFLEVARQALGVARMDGKAVIILMEEGMSWEDDLSVPRDTTVPIVDCFTLPMYYFTEMPAMKTDEWNDDGSPKYWYVNIVPTDGLGYPSPNTKKIHHSRVIFFRYDPIDASTKGLSVLDRCWQAITVGFNVDLGAGEAMFRIGFGHPTIFTEAEDINDLKDMLGNIGNPTRRTWHAWTKQVRDFKYVGAGGAGVDVGAIKTHTVYDEVSIATGIPRPILKGDVAGVQTGSEVNERTYWGILEQDHAELNFKLIWQMAAILNESNGLDIPGLERDPDTHFIEIPEGVTVKWAVHYVETETEKVNVLRSKIELLNGLTTVLTINEVRAIARDLLNKDENEIPDLPDEIGGQVLSIFEPPGAEEAGPQEYLGKTGGTRKATVRKNLKVHAPDFPGKTTEMKEKERKEEAKCKVFITPQGVIKHSTGCVPKGKRLKRTKSRGVSRMSKTGSGLRSYEHPYSIRARKVSVDSDKIPLPRRALSKRAARADAVPAAEPGPVEEPWAPLIGCPVHDRFHKSCELCQEISRAKKNLAGFLLHKGVSASRVSKFMHMSRASVNGVRKTVDAKRSEG